MSLRDALAFEWIKLRTVRATWWSLLAAVTLTVLAAVLIGMSVKASEDNGHEAAQPAPHVAADAVTLAQLGIVVLAALAMTSEYSSGTIATTLRAVPVRSRMLAAKTAVTAMAAVATGVLLAGLGTAVAVPFMGDYGTFTAADAARAVTGIAVYLAALAALTVGVGAVLRSAAGALTTVLMLLLALPEVLRLAGREWLTAVADHLPAAAGTALMTQDPELYGPGRAAAVLLAWSAGTLLCGHLALGRRDA